MEDVGRDYLAKLKTNVGTFRSGGLYWCGTKHIGFDVPYRLSHYIPLDNGHSPTADTYPSTIIPPYTNQDRLLIVRGGIGDLLALSVLQDRAPEVTVVTSKSLFPVLDWWRVKPRRVHFNEPLTMIIYPTRVEDWAKKYGQPTGDQAIAQGSPENWYEIIAKSVGAEGALGGRPDLSQTMRPQGERRLDGQATGHAPSMLVVHQATSRNRSASLNQIVRAIQQVPRGPRNLYFYDDKRRLNGRGDKTSTAQYLADLYYADFVISVDTSAIHFREGIGMPALGLYSSFSAASRTSYYKYTTSIDVTSPCPIQPCFKNLNPCPGAGKEYEYPPCLGEENETMVDQIRTKLKEML